MSSLSSSKVHAVLCCKHVWLILKGVDGKDYVNKMGRPVLMTDADRGEKEG